MQQTTTDAGHGVLATAARLDREKVLVFRQSVLARAVTAAVLTSVAGTGVAQEIEEVIVTATKRDESIQDVPLAITAMTGDFVRDVNLDDVKDLVSFTPGVTGNSTDAFIDGISVRGVRTQDFGTGGDPSAAFFKNGLYEGRNGAVVTSLYDLERVEVLRGPQGFLFGRNAIGGAFSVHTKRPNLDGNVDGYVDLEAAENGRFTAEGAGTLGVSDDFALRLALYHSRDDGYVRNAFDPNRDLLGHDKTAARLSGLFSRDRLSVFATAEYEDADRDGSAYRVSTASPRLAVWESILGPSGVPDDPRATNSDLFGGTDDDAEILTLGAEVAYGFDSFALTWSTGYKDHDYVYVEDYDATPRNAGTYGQDQTGDYFQSEVRLTSTTDGPLSWYVGASLYNEKIDYKATSVIEEEVICAYYGYYYGVSNCVDYFQYWQDYYGTTLDFVPSSDGQMREETFINGRYNGWAAYVDLSYQVNDILDVSVGLRYAWDEKEFTTRTPPPESLLQSYFLPGYMTTGLTDTADWDDLAPRIVVRLTPGDSTMLFASYTEGYKAGGFGTFALDPGLFQWFADGPDEPVSQEDGFRPAQFRPEEVRSYEIGYKGTLLDGRARVDLTGFFYDYTDLQVNFFDGGAQVGNAGQVDGVGIEGNVQIVFNDNWDLVLSAGWLDTEATGLQFLCDGAPDADGLLDGDPEACEGAPLHWAPEFMGSGVLTANYPLGQGAVIVNLETFWEGERGGGFEQIVDSRLDAFQEWALRVAYDSDNNWRLTAYVENLTDELNYAGSQNNNDITPAWFVGPNRPRTFGVRFGYFFD